MSLDIESVLEKKAVVIHLSGRVDSSNANIFEEKALSCIDGNEIEKATVDCGGLQYISSAGLRVFLKLKKKVSDLTAVNVSSDVYDIFDTTGFTELINVQKGLKEVSVEGLPCIGKGATGAVYRLDSERIIKLFNSRFPREAVEKEQQSARHAFVLGVPTCIPFEIVKCDDCYGIIYELINSRTVNELMSENPQDDKLVEEYVKFLKMISSIEYDVKEGEMGLDTIMVYASGKLKGTVLTEEEYNSAVKLFKDITPATTFIHGDAHPGNVMVQNGELMFIDMTTSGFGNPIWDLVAFTDRYCLLTKTLSADEYMAENEMKPEDAQRIWNKAFDLYYQGESDEYIESQKTRILGIAALRHLIGALYEKNPDQNKVAIMKKLVFESL